MNNKLNKKSLYLFDWDIWKLVFDFHSSYLAVETRDPINKIINIYIVNLNNGTKFLLDKLKNNWWSSLAALSDGKLIVQFFKDAKLPEPKGFACYDALGLKHIHQDNESTFAYFSGKNIISTRVFFENIIREKWELENSRKQEISAEEMKSLQPEEIKISFPLQYIDQNPHFNTIQFFVKRCTKKEAIKGIEYLEVKSFIVVSYYIRASEKLENYLLITDLHGEVLEDLLIGSELEAVSKDSFFEKDNQLYFVKNKKELHRYEL